MSEVITFLSGGHYLKFMYLVNIIGFNTININKIDLPFFLLAHLLPFGLVAGALTVVTEKQYTNLSSFK